MRILLVCLVLYSLSFGIGAKSPPQKTKPTKKLSKTSFNEYYIQCQNGNGLGCLYTAQRFLHDPQAKKSDITKAREYYRRACDLGVQTGCNEFNKIALPPHQIYNIFMRLITPPNADDEQDWEYEDLSQDISLGNWFE